jgi:gamma-glutamyl hercynylcysteine S-oxide synthase
VITTDKGIDSGRAIAWYKKNRARTAQIFGLLTDEAYYDQPIALRHPIVFYEGHIPAFSLNTLVKKALGKPGIDERLERLFARGIDPDETHKDSSAPFIWPARAEVRAFVEAADAMVLDALAHGTLDLPGHPLLHRADAVYTILEHEAMHQETLLYMWHRLPHDKKRRPLSYSVVTDGSPATPAEIGIAGGRVQLGARPGSIPFGWDNEFGETTVDVAPFSVARFNVTNGDFLEFLDAGGYEQPELWSPADWAWVQEQGLRHPIFWEHDADGGRWLWRGMFESLPLPLEWPVYVSHAEASAYARWRERRLLTEAEYQRLVTPYPAGGHYDFAGFEPEPVGTHPEGRSADGVDDLVGNGWEWTSTIFRPFPGFHASASYPEYSADFFDESHYVMKGASPVTARELARPTFRNWFRPRYPYVYATFRLARNGS